MATTVGRATVKIVADTREFADQAEREIRRALDNVDAGSSARRVGENINRNMTRNLGAGIPSALRRAFDRVRTRTVTRRVVNNIDDDLSRGLGRIAAVRAGRAFVRQFGIVLQGGISRRAAGTIGAAAVAALGPALAIAGTLVAGSFVTAFGSAIAGIGIFAAAQSEEVQTAFQNMAQSVAEDVVRIAEPFEATLLRIADIARSTFETFLDPLETAFERLAGPVGDFAASLGQAFEALAPTIVPVTDAFIQILEDLGPALADEVFPRMAAAFIAVADAIGENSDVFVSLLTFFLNIPAAVLEFSESLTRITAWFAENPERIRNLLLGIGTAISLLGGPLAIIIGAFTALGGIAVTNSDAISAAWNRLQNAFGPVLAALDPIITRFQEFGETIGGQLSPVLQLLFDQITGSLIPGFGSLLETAAPIIDKFLDFGEEVGAVLIPALGEIISVIIGAIVPTFERLLEILSPVIDQVLDLGGQILAVLIPALKDIVNRIVKEVVPAFLDFLEELEPIVSFLIEVLGPIVVSVFKAIVRVIGGALDIVIGILKTFTALLRGDWEGVWDGIKQILSGALDVIIGLIQISIVGRAVRLVRRGLGIVAGVFRSIGSSIAGIARSMWSSVIGFFRSGLSRIGSAVSSGLRNIGGFFSRLPGQILGAVRGFGSLLYNAGVNLMQGLINGLSAMVSRVTAPVKDAISRVRNLWPFSPAKEGELRQHPPEEWGLNVAAGIAEGLRQGTAQIARAAEVTTQAAIPSPGQANARQAAATATATPGSGNFDIRVFIGDTELTDIIDIQLNERDIDLNRASLRATGTV